MRRFLSGQHILQTQVPAFFASSHCGLPYICLYTHLKFTCFGMHTLGLVFRIPNHSPSKKKEHNLCTQNVWAICGQPGLMKAFQDAVVSQSFFSGSILLRRTSYYQNRFYAVKYKTSSKICSSVFLSIERKTLICKLYV